MKVPFLDLKAQYETIKEEIDAAIQEVVDSCAFAGGPFVEKFEKEYAEFCGVDHAIGVGNGTDALWLSLLALGIGRGDEVITVPNTFIATVEAIIFAGATPVFVDIDENSYTMNPDLVENVITSKTKAIIPVHLFGQPADMDPIMDIAKKHGLFVIEDACQAHGAEYKGKKAGSMGDAGCFSFYPGKNLGAFGEAGAVVTNNSDLNNKIKMLRDHGQSKKYYHDVMGWNARMDGIQGAVLSVKLKHLEKWNEARRRNAELYNELLSEINGIITPKEADYRKHIYHIYAVRTPNRDALIDFLKEQDIYCGIHYPVPVHLQKAIQRKDFTPFSIAEKCSQEFISLPMFAELTKDQIKYISNRLKSYS
ncbi:MAG: DegT/DnrJ/EryC1/StrS family aminotransferase [Spirochaetes bacterium]|nr:DegT/DnrJ/EryC1/StrS family aminotransferase [Spirochaetota bacterium]